MYICIATVLDPGLYYYSVSELVNIFYIYSSKMFQSNISNNCNALSTYHLRGILGGGFNLVIW